MSDLSSHYGIPNFDHENAPDPIGSGALALPHSATLYQPMPTISPAYGPFGIWNDSSA